MVRICWYLRKDLIRIGKAVSDSNAFQARQESSLLLRPYDLSSNGWSVLPCVAFSEDVEWVGCRDGEIFIAEAASAIVELDQSSVEICSNL